MKSFTLVEFLDLDCHCQRLINIRQTALVMYIYFSPANATKVSYVAPKFATV